MAPGDPVVSIPLQEEVEQEELRKLSADMVETELTVMTRICTPIIGCNRRDAWKILKNTS